MPSILKSATAAPTSTLTTLQPATLRRVSVALHSVIVMAKALETREVRPSKIRPSGQAKREGMYQRGRGRGNTARGGGRQQGSQPGAATVTPARAATNLSSG